jgi:hypothetical protein
METFKKNAIIVGALFIITMLIGMIDAYYVAPEFNKPILSMLHIDDKLLIGAFSVLIMAIGIVFIAIAIFPVVKKNNEIIALSYVVLRTIECLLLIVGVICYLYIIAAGKVYVNETDYVLSVTLALKIKYYGFQVAMVVLGFGSLFLCYALYVSRLIPRFLSLWGGIGYLLLFLSAVLDICGVLDTTKGLGALMYIPGGIWELIVFPLWLFNKGFNVSLMYPKCQDDK